MNPIRSDQLCISLVGLFTALAVGVMRSFEQRHLYFVFCIFWGLVAGWKYTIERYLVCNIIPKGQDAELMGIYLFAGQSIAWMPPLIFTAMNEAGVSIRLSMLSLVSFWIVALFFLQCMGSYATVIGEVALMSEVANITPSDCEEIETAASNEK
jgi:MFS-type transporter involved in bile tolerance (Atg22 family)